jgi:ribosomal protein L11 methylase PrmA
VKKDDLVYDLGCGDGRIVVAAAKKYGCKAVGFDIDPRRVAESLGNVKKEDVGDLVKIEKKDIFTVDLSPASVVAIYLLPGLNLKLVPQLNKMKAGSRLVSHNYDIEGYKPNKTVTMKDKEGKDHVLYLWVLPLQKAGD